VADTRFFHCLGADGAASPLTPPAPVPELIESWYWSRALAAMDRELRVDGLTVYLTLDADTLPSYGDDVVVVLIGDEWARVPPYLSRVRLVFRNICGRPNLGCRPLAWPSLATFSSLLPAARAARRWVPGRIARRGARPQVELPEGTFNAVDLPLKPFAERGSDLFFAGSVVHKPGRLGNLKARVLPKTLSREAMVRNVDRLRRRPDVRIDVRLTEGFQESANSDARSYSESLMDSRLALVPRGAVPDTHRFFQALKYGCVPVTDSIPPTWFYERAPMIRLRHWDELERAVLPLLADTERLEALHAQALAWWESVCSEEAVGRLMAQTLNALPPRRSPRGGPRPWPRRSAPRPPAG
jgi:hypothetical protein